jgi:hypothetical protein
VVALDSAHDVADLAQAHLDADLAVRLAKNRVFRGAPAPYAGRGRPCKHRRRFKLRDALTHGRADRSASLEHPVYGTVTVDAWTDLQAEDAATASFTVVRVQVEHLPRHGRPAPLWLAWIGGPLPDDLHQVWRWYLGRFTVEHAFRFAKTSLGWTTVRPRHPAAADRWTWLLAAVFWQLWLARPLVTEQRLPWERPRPAARLTPGRVQRAFGGLLVTLGTPARAPQPRGKIPRPPPRASLRSPPALRGRPPTSNQAHTSPSDSPPFAARGLTSQSVVQSQVNIVLSLSLSPRALHVLAAIGVVPSTGSRLEQVG